MINPKVEIIKNDTPYNWIEIRNIFTDDDKKMLSETYPTNNYRTFFADSHRKQSFDLRLLISPDYKANNDFLSDSWKRFHDYLISTEYKQFLKNITGIDVSNLPFEVDVFKYSKDCIMDAHTDLDIKVLTQVFYFNDEWNESDGGCFSVLNSKNENDVHKKILPIVGNSVILIRSDNSWHSVDKTMCEKSRRSVVVAFFKENCKEGRWWKEQEKYDLHDNIL